MTNYSEITDRVTSAVFEFVEKLEKSQLQHISTQSYGDVIAYYAKTLIDNEFKDLKIAMLGEATKFIQELQKK